MTAGSIVSAVVVPRGRGPSATRQPNPGPPLAFKLLEEIQSALLK